MAELLKDYYSKEFISRLCGHIHQVMDGFDSEKFTSLIFSGEWDSLALKERINRITAVLHLVLPTSYELALPMLVRLSKLIRKKETNHQNYFYSFLPNYVEKYGMAHFDLSIDALEEITLLTSAEFAVRPFIQLDPQRMLKKLKAWSTHQDERVRRLSSEGCRPLLPWAPKLREFVQNPALILPILDTLKNDGSLYVRKSVANNLNDISKIDPEMAISTMKSWKGESKNVDWVVRHAARTLIKNSNDEILQLFDIRNELPIKLVDFITHDTIIYIGDVLVFGFKIHVDSPEPVKLRLGFIIDFMKSNEKTSPKVFYISEAKFEQGTYQFEKKFRIANLTTRKIYPGEHQLSILINGKRYSSLPFLVR